ncbi:MAG: DUF3006 domain-containing protein [Ruminococcus sp.]|nr:DUF3006 domain-containing protein [Ruminococcus sp.]MCM1381788.1 DUF3006 domain-containing protein [Muribaculaceae bacterium]MCM1479451.1 DUF3006 domain-containing protein [Muribaculaceae bacterium]
MLIIDRITENTAIVEDGDRRFEVPKKTLAKGVKEGDVVVPQNEMYIKDENATNERRKKIIELQNNLWE